MAQLNLWINALFNPRRVFWGEFVLAFIATILSLCVCVLERACNGVGHRRLQVRVAFMNSLHVIRVSVSLPLRANLSPISPALSLSVRLSPSPI